MTLQHTALHTLRCAALVAAIVLAAGGCDFTMKYVRFPVQEGNTKVYYEKLFDDLLGADNDQAIAYGAIEHHDITTALFYCQRGVRAHPGEAYPQYDLAIIYEIKGDWEAARVAIQEAIRLDQAARAGAKGQQKQVDADLVSELRFIENHTPLRR
jgi:hypothetical protein